MGIAGRIAGYLQAARITPLLALVALLYYAVYQHAHPILPAAEPIPQEQTP